MATPTPTPYRNIGRDIEMEDANAEHLQGGVEDAKARLKIAAEQYKANPIKPVEDIYNKATQDLLDRTNRMERARTRARELEIEATPKPVEEAQPSRSPSSILSLLGGVPTEEAEAAKKVDQPKPYNLETIMTMAAKKAAPRTATPTLAPTPTPIPAPTPEPSPLEKAALQASAASNAIRRSGATALGQKTEVTGKQTNDNTNTTNLAVDQNYIDTVGSALRSTPEWVGQAKGIDELEEIVKLQAQRDAGKSNIDLSALGAYEDMRNAHYGEKSNFAGAWKSAPESDDTFKNMGEIQRRRNDMSKELIDALKPRSGQVVDKDNNVIGYTAGYAMPNPSGMNGQNNLHFRELKELRRFTDASFKEPANQLDAINNMISRIESNNPSYIGAMPMKMEQMDSGQQRVLLGLIGMETYDNSAPARLTQYLKTLTKGTLTDHTKKLLLDRLRRSAEDTKLKMKATDKDVRDFAGTLGSLNSSDVEGIAGSKVRATETAFPRAVKAGSGNDPKEIERKKKEFMEMLKAAGAI